jgi:nucleoid DNA-binding protein
MARKKVAASRKVAKKKKVVRKTARKATTRKTTSRSKKTTKKTAARKVVAKKAKVKSPKKLTTSPVKKAMTKSEMLSIIAEGTALTRKDVSNVFEALSVVIKRHVTKGGAGECTLPGLVKFRVVRKPAVKARKGINPFTGEETIFKAKPARNVIKVRTLKKLKEMTGK